MKTDSWLEADNDTATFRRWILAAMLVSILFHAVVLGFFAFMRLERFSTTSERLVPRAFQVNRTTVDPTLLLQDEKPESTQKTATPAVRELNLPAEKPSADETLKEVRIAPQATEIAKPIIADRPRIDSASMQETVQLQSAAARAIESDLQNLSDSLLKETQTNPRTPTLKAADFSGNPSSAGARDLLDGSGAGGGGIPGLQSLDDALAGGGAGYDPSKPIGIPGGALFEYNSADLSSVSLGELQKLATLLKRFPKGVITIEGHTDSFGGADYNFGLSERRAQSVKNWVVSEMGIAPDRILTVGRGISKLIVPATGSIEQQAPNRRVEISIRDRP